MKQKRRALSQEYLDPGRTAFRGGVKRQVVGITLVTVPLVFGGKAIDVLGDGGAVLRWVAGILACAGAVGGALYHPVRRFWWRGAVAGVVVTAGACAMYRFYQRLRPEPFGPEFAVVAFLGALPGVFVYYLLMRHQYVAEAELSA